MPRKSGSSWALANSSTRCVPLSRPWGMVAHLTAQGVGQKLVSVAYAEQWDGLIHSLRQPCCGLFAPGLAVTDHGGGTCHDNAVPVSRVSGQLSGFRIEHGNFEPG